MTQVRFRLREDDLEIAIHTDNPKSKYCLSDWVGYEDRVVVQRKRSTQRKGLCVRNVTIIIVI